MKITEIKENSKNPRSIEKSKLEKLKSSIDDFPKMLSLRPIVIDNENVIIGGNMRFRALKELGYKEIPDNWVKKASELTEEEKQRFIISDNVGFGEWNWDLIQSDWDLELIDDWGLDVPDLEDELDTLEDGEEIEIPQSVQLEPPKEYIIIMAEPNSHEWEEMKETLKLKMVRRGGYKKGSGFDAVGLERVLDWDELKKRMK